MGRTRSPMVVLFLLPPLYSCVLPRHFPLLQHRRLSASVKPMHTEPEFIFIITIITFSVSHTSLQASSGQNSGGLPLPARA